MDDLSLLGDLVARAKTAGADEADALLSEGTSLSHAQRLGRTEKLERSENFDLGLRVIVGKRQAIVSANERDPKGFPELVSRAIDMAKAVPEDPYVGLAAPDQLARAWPELDLLDAVEPSPATLIEHAKTAEEAARAVPGVTNSDGAAASWGQARVFIVASNGFAATYAGSHHYIGVSVIAGDGVGMQTDSDYSSAVHAGNLADPAEIGHSAGMRAVERLNARKVATGKYPVLFDRRVSGGLLRHLIGAISGPSVARGTSFLKDKLGQQIFASGIRIVDDPHVQRGLRSKPFDAEGVANRRRDIVADGVLETWLLDLGSARQLGLTTTGHASRGMSSPPGPSPTNLWLERGGVTRDELIGDVAQGLLVTELMGMGVNGVTGDYSRGASGFWIEGGAIAYPVHEITIAGNLKDMFRALIPASDLVFKTGIDAPTVRIDGMTVAGR
ncbi:MAG TPA: metallopeptidase TldD-related protein [Stellaceae bacterium]|jgi:PmbA protein|nr:metallopeptidase TldD-related protein [Stellaceae bacterium]